MYTWINDWKQRTAICFTFVSVHYWLKHSQKNINWFMSDNDKIISTTSACMNWMMLVKNCTNIICISMSSRNKIYLIRRWNHKSFFQICWVLSLIYDLLFTRPGVTVLRIEKVTCISVFFWKYLFQDNLLFALFETISVFYVLVLSHNFVNAHVFRLIQAP